MLAAGGRGDDGLALLGSQTQEGTFPIILQGNYLFELKAWESPRKKKHVPDISGPGSSK